MRPFHSDSADPILRGTILGRYGCVNISAILSLTRVMQDVDHSFPVSRIMGYGLIRDSRGTVSIDPILIVDSRPISRRKEPLASVTLCAGLPRSTPARITAHLAGGPIEHCHYLVLSSPRDEEPAVLHVLPLCSTPAYPFTTEPLKRVSRFITNTQSRTGACTFKTIVGVFDDCHAATLHEGNVVLRVGKELTVERVSHPHGFVQPFFTLRARHVTEALQAEGHFVRQSDRAVLVYPRLLERRDDGQSVWACPDGIQSADLRLQACEIGGPWTSTDGKMKVRNTACIPCDVDAKPLRTTTLPFPIPPRPQGIVAVYRTVGQELIAISLSSDGREVRFRLEEYRALAADRTISVTQHLRSSGIIGVTQISIGDAKLFRPILAAARIRLTATDRSPSHWKH